MNDGGEERGKLWGERKREWARGEERDTKAKKTRFFDHCEEDTKQTESYAIVIVTVIGEKQNFQFPFNSH